ncbi:MAG: prephenate dehydrogenase [Elusimicrobiota bacterium]|jgi:prephenate dehydrogenase|nr:prephenate dehydrogenase [Elusimicrobiota bacterium]
MNDKDINLNNILIYGLGLIGGSIAKKLREKSFNPQKNGTLKIFALTHRIATANKAIELNIVDDASDDLKKILTKYKPNFIILCVPPSKNFEILSKIYPFLDNKQAVLITDVSSVKGKDYSKIKKFLIAKNQETGKKIEYIGSHPMAGIEKKGLENSTKDILDNARVLITPFENYENTEFLGKLVDFWKFLDTTPKIISVKNHDILTGFTSHFSHLVAAMQTNLVFEEAKKKPDIISAISSSLESITRISNSDPILWTEIIKMNNENLLNILQKYKKHVQKLEQILYKNDLKEILNFFNKTKEHKEELDFLVTKDKK